MDDDFRCQMQKLLHKRKRMAVVRLECAALGGVVEGEEYAVQVTLRALLPEGQAEAFSMRMTELSAGAFGAVELGQVLRPAPLEGR